MVNIYNIYIIYIEFILLIYVNNCFLCLHVYMPKQYNVKMLIVICYFVIFLIFCAVTHCVSVICCLENR